MIAMRLFFSLVVSLLLLLNSEQLLARQVLLHTLNGQTVPFESLKGQWILLNYWASWCDACVNEISQLNQLYRDNQGRIALFGINYENLPPGEQQTLIQQFNLAYPSLRDDPREMLHLGEIQALPVTFIFDHSGQLRDTLYGELTTTRFNTTLDKLEKKSL